MTKDIRKYKATADAIILLRFEARYLKIFQPKPENQVISALRGTVSPVLTATGKEQI